LQPPRNYQSLRDEHARATQESAPQKAQAKAPEPAKGAEAQPEPQPYRPQVRPSTGRVTDSGGRVAQEELANDLHKQNLANAALRQRAQPVTAEQQSGKDRLAADLSEAKEGRVTVNQERDADHAPPANAQQKDNARAAPEKQGGKERLAADLKEAKESAPAPEQGHDRGRSR
jgi:hypothetical protein